MFYFLMYLSTKKDCRLDARWHALFFAWRRRIPSPNGDRVSLAIGGIPDVYDPAFQNWDRSYSARRGPFGWKLASSS